jgi:hypothetical protein
MNKPHVPNRLGKGKLPESQSFGEDWFLEWSTDGLFIGQIHQLLDRMYVSYRIM